MEYTTHLYWSIAVYGCETWIFEMWWKDIREKKRWRDSLEIVVSGESYNDKSAALKYEMILHPPSFPL